MQVNRMRNGTYKGYFKSIADNNSFKLIPDISEDIDNNA